MRILQVAHYFLPKHIAGVETYTYNLAKEFQKNHKVWIYCREDGSFDKTYHQIDENYNGLNLRRIFYNVPRTPQTTYRNYLLDKNFSLFLDKIKPDIIHFQHLERLSVNFIKVAKQKGIPTVLTLHDYWFICPLIQMLINGNKLCTHPYSEEKCVQCIKTWFKINEVDPCYELVEGALNIIKKRTEFMRNILTEVDIITAPSEFLRKKYIDFGVPPERIKYSEYGINSKVFSNFMRVDSKKIRFGFVGSIMKHKGLHLLIAAFKKIKINDIELKVFGQGYDLYFDQMLKLMKTDKRIRYMGPFSEQNIANVYSQFDILVIPSVWYENSPFVIHEAFAVKAPVIGANIGAIPEKIQDMKTGLLFNLEQKDDLCNKMLTIINNKDLVKKIQSGLKITKTIGQQAEELNQIYAAIVKDNRKENVDFLELPNTVEHRILNNSNYIVKIKDSNLNLAKKALHENEICVKSMPVDLNIETTTKCNLKCLMCQRQSLKDNALPPPMPREVFATIAQKLFLYVKNASFTVMGEPLLSNNLYGMLDSLDNYSIGLDLITNGLLLTNDTIILKILKSLQSINISLDAACKETYSYIRNSRDFDLVIKNLKRFNQLRGKTKKDVFLCLSFVAMRKNIEELPDFIQLAKDLQADAVAVNHLIVFDEKLNHESLINYKSIANKHFAMAMDKARKLEINLSIPKSYSTNNNKGSGIEAVSDNRKGKQNPLAFYQIENSRGCKFLWTKPYISSNGDVFPCCGHMDRPLMGNILEESFQNIWNSKLYREMRKSFFTGNLFDCCQKCTTLPIVSTIINKK